MLTHGILTRPWCLLEIASAFAARQPTVLLEVRAGGFEPAEARALVRRLPEALPSASLALLHTHLGPQLAGLHEALEALIDRVEAEHVVPWDACVGDAAMVAQAQHLIEAMAVASEQPIQWMGSRESSGAAALSKLAVGSAALISCVGEDCAAHARVLQSSLSLRVSCPVVLGRLGSPEGEASTGDRDEGREAVVPPPAADGDQLLEDHSFNGRHQKGAHKSAAAMHGPSAAEASDACVLLLTKNVLSDANCLLEAYHAVASGKPLVPVTLSGYGYDFGAAAGALEALGETLAAHGQEACSLNASCKEQLGIDASEVQRVLVDALPNIIAIAWDPVAGAHHLAAVVEEVVRRLPPRRESTRCAVASARMVAIGRALRQTLRHALNGGKREMPPDDDDGAVVLRSRRGTPIVRSVRSVLGQVPPVCSESTLAAAYGIEVHNI